MPQTAPRLQCAVRLAVRYYADYPDEIDRRIQANRERADRAEAAWRHERQLVGDAAG